VSRDLDSAIAPSHYTFGPFVFDVRHRDLWLPESGAVPITPRVLNPLLLFVAHPQLLLGKEWLMARLWPEQVVGDNSLSQSISALRRTLGCDGTRYIRTEARRGFRFICPVAALYVPDPHYPGNDSREPTDWAQPLVTTAPLTSNTVVVVSALNTSLAASTAIVPTASCRPR
jgi:DNA-binding winged helix-turn-helix (wHTH) protein